MQSTSSHGSAGRWARRSYPSTSVTQEESSAAELRLQAELVGLPTGVGIASVLERDAAGQGSLSISSLTAVMPGGYLVDVPGNAALPAVLAGGHGRSRRSACTCTCSTKGQRGGACPSTRTIRPHGAALGAPAAALQRARPSTARCPRSSWRPAPKNWPGGVAPGRRLGPAAAAGGLQSLPGRDAARAGCPAGARRSTSCSPSCRTATCAASRLNNARRTLCEVYRLRAMREDMGRHVHPHPYHFFDALRRFYFEVCCYLEDSRTARCPSINTMIWAGACGGG